MKKIRTFFETPKKAALSALCIVAVLAVLGSGTVFAAGTIAKNTSIGEENAQNFAFADAGVDPVAAENVQTEFDFEQGTFVYEVSFTADGTEYEYWIKAADGAVLKKELEIVSLDGESATVTAQITVEEAQRIALADSGEPDSMTITKAELDVDNGISVYEIEFSTDSAEYEYEINAETGAIYSKSREIHVAAAQENTAEGSSEPDTQTAEASGNGGTADGTQDGGQIGLDAAKEIALADAGVLESEVTYTKEKLDYEDGVEVYEIEFYTSVSEYEYEINANNGAIRSKETEARISDSSDNSQNSDSYIGVDKAKLIAVEHAGFAAASNLTFKKAKLEKEHGQMVYEVEFYKEGREYEYKIHAVTGEILEYEID